MVSAMSLLRTKFVQVGSLLAFTGVDPSDGQTFLWGNAKDFDLKKGDVIQVLEIHRREGTPWARVVVAVIKGKCVARVGQVSINLESRLQRSWQVLTQTGSMAAARRPPSQPDPQEIATVPSKKEPEK